MSPGIERVPVTGMKADAVVQAVWRHFTSQSWAGLTEVTARSGRGALRDQWSNWRPGDPIPQPSEEDKERRIDMLLLREPRKEGLGPVELMAIEVKVSRADFLSDIKNPAKQAPWRELAHRHAYAVPAGLVRKEEVPLESGLIYITRLRGSNGDTDVAGWERFAPYTDTSPDLPPWLAMNFARRASWAEGKAKGWLMGANDTDVEAMRAELERLRRQLNTKTNQLSVAQEARDAWRQVAAAHTPSVPCRYCGQPITPKTWTSRNYFGWKHIDKAHNDECDLLRMAAGRYAVIQPADDDIAALVGSDS